MGGARAKALEFERIGSLGFRENRKKGKKFCPKMEGCREIGRFCLGFLLDGPILYRAHIKEVSPIS